MAQQLKVFVSHSHDDDAFCREVVGALRGAGADVWYDEHNLGSGQLMDTIERELRARPIVVVILSAAALRSGWVRDECTWAYSLIRRDPSRELLPVTASPIEEDAIWLFLSTFKRIEAPGLKPFPVAEACGRLLHALALTPGAATHPTPAPTPTPQPAERLEELLSQGKAILAQDKYAEAIPFLERATQLDPRSFDAWASLGFVYVEMKRPAEGLAAYDQALNLDDKQARVWSNKGIALNDLMRYEEALSAFDRSLALDPNNAYAWNGKGNALWGLKRYEDVPVAYDRALALDPNYRNAWNNKAISLRALGRTAEAEQAERRAKELG